MSTTLHTYNDGSKLILLTAKALIAIPIWKGNRIIDTEHADNIRKSIGPNVRRLDSGYRIICYNETDAEGRHIIQKYIVDGQHRVSVLKVFFTHNLCEEDFPITATEIIVSSEADAIQYFNAINNAKPILFKEDPNLIVNKYIEQLVATFPVEKKGQQPRIRSTPTHRPYLHIDRIREAFLRDIEFLQAIPIKQFATSLKAANERLLRMLELQLVIVGSNTPRLVEPNMALVTGMPKSQQSVAERCIELQFALAFDQKFEWVRELCATSYNV